VLALAAGAVLLALAIPFLHLREGRATHGRRWAYRAVTLIAASLVVYAIFYPVTEMVGKHEHRKPAGEPPSTSVGPATSPAREPVWRK
jgi:hypothetical protein